MSNPLKYLVRFGIAFGIAATVSLLGSDAAGTVTLVAVIIGLALVVIFCGSVTKLNDGEKDVLYTISCIAAAMLLAGGLGLMYVGPHHAVSRPPHAKYPVICTPIVRDAGLRD